MMKRLFCIKTLLSGVIDLKYGDIFKLECNHEGKVIWISSDGNTIGVRGVRRSCRTCGKKSAGSWTPCVYIFSLDEVESNKS